MQYLYLENQRLVSPDLLSLGWENNVVSAVCIGSLRMWYASRAIFFFFFFYIAAWMLILLLNMFTS